MLYKTKSTVFNVNADCIVNTINCDGFMGKGLALEFALRYPKLNEIYQDQCKKKLLHTGKVYVYNIDGQCIINFPTKYHFQFPSKYEWIEQGLNHFVNIYKELKIRSIAFPLLGARNGELDPKIVIEIMEKYLSKLDIDVYICLDSSPEAEGKEKEMLDLFNNYNMQNLSKKLKLNDSQSEFLVSKMPFNRFWQIGLEKPIKGAAYKKIFNFFYNYTLKDDEPEQLSLF